ncbi:patched family-domain-containing protein [Podospora australis]|uniref:Patched family-domain-containing protein n=1 Tax=Podospora australis TaxID=1536484 RepID=A0AAN6X3U7_9PEZI|nr:patched family-domain-containing protein [Podospora australis]
MTKLSQLFASGGLLLSAIGSVVVVVADVYTPTHEAGRCAIRSHCGSKSFFGSQLPCLDNGLAQEPDAKLRKQLTDLCGPKWNEGPVCCDSEQVDALKSNLQTANQIISSCPACKDNFFNMFCTFTCSPDQSLFINVTKTMEKAGKTLVTELDQLVSKDYGTGFYNSCKDVKFGPTNSRAMDLMGGGAKNYTQLLKFLGQERLGGSPFQINFPVEYPEHDMKPLPMTPKSCGDEDPNFRCACIDCPAICPELPDVEEAGSCRVGPVPCLSFASLLTYLVLLFLAAAAVVGQVAWRKHAKRRRERLSLLAGPADSEDDDEGDLTQNPAMFDRPQKTYIINTWCDTAFSKLGHFAARFPAITIGISVIMVLVLSAGLFHFEIEKDPARLWVSPTSDAAQEKAFFDSQFGAFYRAEKVFLVNDTNPEAPGPVLSYDTLLWWMGVEKSVKQLKGNKFFSNFQDLCLKPTGSACVVQSVAAYFQDDPDMVSRDTWKTKLRSCAQSPVECRPEYGQPLEPNMILGGYPDDDSDDPAEARAMTVTWVLNNHPEGSGEAHRAMDWEETLKNRLLVVQEEAKERGLRLSFSTEISLEQELNKSTNTDAKIIVISYIIMFLYASISLGSQTLSLRDLVNNPYIALVQSKFTLGIAGIFIVLMSITASIGLFSWVGLKATLIIVDVIPFIVLAVGVDNIFLIVHEFERLNISDPDAMVEKRASKALGRMGPSILFSAITETASFALGALVGMPAVRNFAIYAAGAVFINAILQVTMFISVLTLNQIRAEDARADCFPCVQVKSARVHLSNNNAIPGARHYETPADGLLQRFISKSYAPRLLGKKTKAVVMTIFLGLFAVGIALLPEVELGLDQRVAIPDDSYLIPYFNDLYEYMEAGPPVYFVARGLNATQRSQQQKMCARYTTCQQLSLTNILEQERKRADVSYISTPTASWIDDFFQWLNPDNEACCVDRRKPCFANRDPAWNITLAGMPEGEEFVGYLKRFLNAPTDEDCPLGGQASYGSSVVIDSERSTVPASHFRTSHRPLRSQDDFIKAYASARRIATDISANTGLSVFPYSIFYVFFDQYASIVGLTTALLGSALAMVFIVSTVLLGSILTATVVTFTVAMAIIDIIGAMAVMGVSLNAVSLVNLIICVGIAVEFCAHIARAFMLPSRVIMERAKNNFRGRDARAWTALANVGGSVFSGITVTKILGVTVLAFTRSKIFEIYYFRVWVALVLFAATHALVFLPVALSLFGGEGYIDPESDNSLAENLANRTYRDLVGGDDSDSD